MKSLTMRTKMRMLCSVLLTVVAMQAGPVMAQTAQSGRGGPGGGRGGAGAAPAPGAASTGRSDRLSDPRPAFEMVEARIKKIDEQELREPPKRDYQIEPGATLKTKLFRADPKLFENKFMARLNVLSLGPREPELRTPDPRTRSEFPAEMRTLNAVFRSGHYYERGGNAKPPNEIFQSLADRCPAEQRPEGALAFLISPEGKRDVGFTQPFGSDSWAYLVYAPTAEDAEARAAAILRLFDCGASRPLQRFFVAEAKRHLTQARATCDEYSKLSDEIAAEEEKIARPSEVSPDILSQLKAQRVMVAVELAGLNARVKACDSMLNEPKRLEVSTLQSISDMKVKAEIERIGTKEKLDMINSYIAEGDRREGIQKNLDQLSGKRTNAARQASYLTREADTCAALVDYYAPRELEGNKIVVSPIEWTE